MVTQLARLPATVALRCRGKGVEILGTGVSLQIAKAA
jgi:hypothetical protein